MMHKRIHIVNGFPTDHFSLKKIVKKVGNVVKDATLVMSSPVTNMVKTVTGKDVTGGAKASTKLGGGLLNVSKDLTTLGVAPVKNAIGSVTGKGIHNTYVTGVGKVVGTAVDVGNKGVNIVAKSFADTVTGGYATKALNVIRTKENKEKAYGYGEMKSKPSEKTGIKLLDKAASIVPIASAVVGSVYAGVAGADKFGGMIGKKDKSNVKPTSTVIGDNVLNSQLPLPADSELPGQDNGLPTGLPAGAYPSDLPGGNKPASNNALASFGGEFKFTPITIGALILAVILLIVAIKNKPANA